MNSVLNFDWPLNQDSRTMFSYSYMTTFCSGFQVCFDELGDDKQQIFQSWAVVVYLLFNYSLCGTKDCFPHRYFSWVLICFRLTSALFWNENTRDNLRRNW